MGLMKIYSGSEVLAIALKDKIETEGVDVVMKDNVQSARLAGFGSMGQAVELTEQSLLKPALLTIISHDRRVAACRHR